MVISLRGYCISRVFSALVICTMGLSLKADVVGGSTWEETKDALRTVLYSYTYGRHEDISVEVDEKYDFVKMVMHEDDPGWLSGLLLAKGRQVTIVYGGAGEEDVEKYCKRFEGRTTPWGKGSIRGKVHAGFLKHFHALWPQVYKGIITYAYKTKQDPSKLDFDIVGHSMGAGLAHIAAMRLRTGLLYKTIPPRALFLDLPQYTEENRPSRIRVVTFGGMRVLDQLAAIDYKERLDLYKTTLRVTHKKDWVIDKLPQIFGLAHVGELVNLPNPEGVFDSITSSRAESHRLPSYNVALFDLLKSEEDFKKDEKSLDFTFHAGVVGVMGMFFTGPLEIALSLKAEGLAQAKMLDEERELSDRLSQRWGNGT